jgi:hypothetical protein
VWVRGQGDLPELGKWVDKLPKVKDKVEGVSGSENYRVGIARVNAGEGAGAFSATVPFMVPTHDGDAYFMSNPTYDKPYWGQFDTWEDNPHIHTGTRRDHAHTRVEVFDEASQPWMHGNQLYLPTGCHLAELSSGKGKRLYLGDGTDPERVLFARNSGNGDKKVEVHKMATAWVVSDPRTDKQASFDTYTDAEAYLVDNHGLGVPDAKKMISQVMRNKEAAVLVKYAPDYVKAADLPMPNDMGLAHGTPKPSIATSILNDPKTPTPGGVGKGEWYPRLNEGRNMWGEPSPIVSAAAPRGPGISNYLSVPGIKPDPILDPNIAGATKPISSETPANRPTSIYGSSYNPPTIGVEKPTLPVSEPKPAPMPGVVPGMAKGAADVTEPNMGLARNYPNAPTLPFDLISAPSSFADDIVPTETSSSMSVPINDMLTQSTSFDRERAYPTDYGVQTEMPGIGNGPRSSLMGSTNNDLEAVAAAAQSGQRELFDTAALAALVKHKSLGSLLSESRTSIGKAVTGLADLLAHLYWNTDEWAERFGEGEIGPLEDQMRSQFEKLGDLQLTLQEEAVSEGMDAGILPEMKPSDGSEQPDK